MQPLDWLIVLSCITIAAGGFQVGFVAKATSWIGTGVGVILALLSLPVILRNSSDLSVSGRLGIIVLVTLAGLLLGQILGLFAGARLANIVPPGPLRALDRVAGATAGVMGVLFLLWLFLPTFANVPGWTSAQVRSSVVAQSLDSALPQSPDWAMQLNRLVGSSTFPSVFQNLAPAPDTGPPPESVSLSSAVLANARQAAVKVEGTACRRVQDGSGFVVEPGLVVTNAHVVAGERRTSVISSRGDTFPATVVAFDAQRDLALLRVPRLTADPLPLGEPHVGDDGAVFGHPGGQAELAITPAEIRQKITAVGMDLYGKSSTKRSVLILAARLAQGDSGGALVNQKGQVIGVAFAIAPDRPGTSYALHVDELREVLARPHLEPVNTGPCLAE